MLTRSLRADLGVMITASHNPYTDNGITLFGPDGSKLADETELEIEALMDDSANWLAAKPSEIEQVAVYTDAKGRYVEDAKATFPRYLDLDGIKIVLDCASGAAHRTAGFARAPRERRDDQRFTERAKQQSSTQLDSHRRYGAARGQDRRRYRGIALGGDRDRLIAYDESGRIVDGDQLLASFAVEMKAQGTL